MKISETILFKSELPLIKKTDKFNTYLKPIVVTRYSPNNSKNIADKDLRLTYDNIYSLNRIGSKRNIEEGGSISLGIEYNVDDKQNNNILGNCLREQSFRPLGKSCHNQLGWCWNLNNTRSALPLW